MILAVRTRKRSENKDGKRVPSHEGLESLARTPHTESALVVAAPQQNLWCVEEGKVQAEAGESGLYLFDILLFGENAIHGLVLFLLPQLNAVVSIDGA